MRRLYFVAFCLLLLFARLGAQEGESSAEGEETTEASEASTEDAEQEPTRRDEAAGEENEVAEAEGAEAEEHNEEAEEHSEEPACEEHHGGADVVLVLFFMLLIGLVARYALQSVPVPYTALLLIAGMLLGTMQINLTKLPPSKTGVETVVAEEGEVAEEAEVAEEGHGESGGHGEEGGEGHGFGILIPNHESWENFAIGINAWRQLDPELMLLVFLPALIFSSAFHLNFHITKKSFGQVLILAGPGVIIGTVLTACFTKVAFPYDWCWPKAFMFGAMISATDPVAVVALLKEVGASARLGTVIEGESLFNDGTAFVFFLLFRDMIATSDDCLNDEYNCKDAPTRECETGTFVPSGCLTDRNVGESLEFFLQLALGGPAIGILFGFAATFWIQYIYNDLLTEISVTLVTAYLTFYVAEDVAEVSGVLATVALGLFMGSFAKDRVSSNVHEPLHVFWEMMEYVANTVIFVYTGLKISLELFDTTNPGSKFIGGREWGFAILLYIILQIIRFATIFSLRPILNRMGYGMNWKDAVVAVWGGLRGAVGLALALIVQLDEEHIPPSFRSYTIFYLGFIVICTLLINGSTMPYLLKALGVTKTSPEKLEVLFHILNEMEDSADRQAKGGEDDLLGMPDYEQLKKLTELNITKIVPNAHEIREVIQAAKTLHRPSSFGIQHSITRTSMSRVQSVDFDPQHVLGDIIEENEIEVASEQQQVVQVEKPVEKSKWQRWKDEWMAMWHNMMASFRRTLPDSPVKNTFTPDLLVQDLRSRLLQGVKTAYAEWLEKGYIDARCMFDLMESADTAVDHLDEPISDWAYLAKAATPSRWRVEIQKLKSLGCRGPVGEIALKAISKFLFDSMMYSVLLARTYIMAHAEAEYTLLEHIKKEFGEDDQFADPSNVRLMEDAVDLVVKESKEATKEAHELMRNFRMVYPEILRAIKTKLTAQEVLLEKAAYVHQIESAGLIENREATSIREMIDAKIKYLMYNTLVLELPHSHDLLHSHALFFSLPKNIFDSQVWPHAKPKVFTKGEKIYAMGNEPKHVTIVVRGLVKMIDSSNKEESIGDGFGSALGVSEIMLNRPRALTLLCETTSEVIQIDRQVFESLVGRFGTIRSRAWQLTGMMLTFLNPWGSFINASILELAHCFKNSQLLEFEPNQELRVRTRAFLVQGTVKEAGFDKKAEARVITGPAPLGPMMGVYNTETECKVLRIPYGDEVHRHSKSASFNNTRRMLARSSGSLVRISAPAFHPSATFTAGATGSNQLGNIPEGRATQGRDVTGTQGPESGASQQRGTPNVNYALSADLETRQTLSRFLSPRGSIEF